MRLNDYIIITHLFWKKLMIYILIQSDLIFPNRTSIEDGSTARWNSTSIEFIQIDEDNGCSRNRWQPYSKKYRANRCCWDCWRWQLSVCFHRTPTGANQKHQFEASQTTSLCFEEWGMRTHQSQQKRLRHGIGGQCYRKAQPQSMLTVWKL